MTRIYAYLGGLLFVMVLVTGGWWYVHHLRSQIASLQVELANSKIENKVLQEKIVAQKQYAKDKAEAERRASNEKTEIDDAVQDPHRDLEPLYNRYRVHNN